MQETDLALITDAIRLAGRVATGFAGKTAQSWDKPGNAGPVTEADLAVNRALETALRSARPDYGWLSEESEDGPDRLDQETLFIVDPIDGTRSFVEGSRTWAHSVAVSHGGRITAAAVYLPLRDKLYTAALGEGAFCNGARLTASDVAHLPTADVLAAKPVMEPRHWAAGEPGFRRAHRPSLAYRLGLVAEARFDAMLTFRPSWEWDIAAGALIVTEAGGVCTDKSGAPLRFNNATPQLNGVIAAGPKLHAEVLAALAPDAA
ncbi:inositol monophosphatase family protein [Roseobacter sinensis]|uniref:3'(2'),5'-bisphosphate nucleotidase CysQ n=1 Tax=Roseobacter sinensis TaxID=2931391 RepID=A0ABT3B9C7_9RHOB|nr:3'(2'),5'-bisphosphate nucleotidase CysQ [Roseobacter sp. WL0113]MCV3270193.1 3'(2'),5'-bisphosphate nucleotidase CysQ [Roseobacter sp. WL0113]